MQSWRMHSNITRGLATRGAKRNTNQLRSLLILATRCIPPIHSSTTPRLEKNPWPWDDDCSYIRKALRRRYTRVARRATRPYRHGPRFQRLDCNLGCTRPRPPPHVAKLPGPQLFRQLDRVPWDLPLILRQACCLRLVVHGSRLHKLSAETFFQENFKNARRTDDEMTRPLSMQSKTDALATRRTKDHMAHRGTETQQTKRKRTVSIRLVMQHHLVNRFKRYSPGNIVTTLVERSYSVMLHRLTITHRHAKVTRPRLRFSDQK